MGAQREGETHLDAIQHRRGKSLCDHEFDFGLFIGNK